MKNIAISSTDVDRQPRFAYLLVATVYLNELKAWTIE